jgi:hypothetical protein
MAASNASASSPACEDATASLTKDGNTTTHCGQQ